MADFVATEKTKNDFNNGVKFVNGDTVSAETINNLIENQLYLQQKGITQERVSELISLAIDGALQGVY